MTDALPPSRILSAAAIDGFITDGFVVLREAFPRQLAADLEGLLWGAMSERRDDPTTWRQDGIVVPRIINDPAVAAMSTPRYRGAIDDLLGPGRWRPMSGLGYMVIRFPGFHTPPWSPPDTGWHVDGNFFQHHPHSREQGLAAVEMFSDVAPGGGATVVRPGSHRRISRLLAQAEPAGLTPEELGRRADAATRDMAVVEVPGRAGDVLLMHPHLIHASSDNTGSTVRLAANRCISLVQDMDPDRQEDSRSVVERAIADALADLVRGPGEVAGAHSGVPSG